MHTIRMWAALALLVLVSCAGATARQQVLLPAMRTAWPPIREVVETELQQAPDSATTAAVAAAESALQAGTSTAVTSVAWPLIDTAHESGLVRSVQAGAIGPGVADSLRERAKQFAAARVEFVGGGQ